VVIIPKSTVARELVAKGPDALKLFSNLSVNRFITFDIGQAKHAIQCKDEGKVVAPGILMRLADEEFCTQSSPAPWTSFNLRKGRYNATTEPMTGLTSRLRDRNYCM
jgi:vanillate/3-O-methylgallate O-demethylase